MRTNIERILFMRVGMGYDVHRLVEDRKLILGGVEIPYEKGLLGHSDADVLVHAIMDAILGAAGMGDIGLHFPDNDDTYKDASEWEAKAKDLAARFKKNFVKYEGNESGKALVAAGPQI